MNLLMIAPLCDSRGTIRYFIGAQVDVSGLVKECTDFESLQRLVIQQHTKTDDCDSDRDNSMEVKKDEFQELSEMLNMAELDTVRRWGGRMHREHHDEDDVSDSGASQRPRLLLKETSPGLEDICSSTAHISGKLSGVYQHVCFWRLKAPHVLDLRCLVSLD